VILAADEEDTSRFDDFNKYQLNKLFNRLTSTERGNAGAQQSLVRQDSTASSRLATLEENFRTLMDVVASLKEENK
jgi:hypothetical protein